MVFIIVNFNEPPLVFFHVVKFVEREENVLQFPSLVILISFLLCLADFMQELENMSLFDWHVVKPATCKLVMELVFAILARVQIIFPYDVFRSISQQTKELVVEITRLQGFHKLLPTHEVKNAVSQ